MANYHLPEDDQQVRASRADEPSPDLAAQTTQPDQSVVKAATAPPNAQAAPPSTSSPQPETLRIDGKPEPVIVVRDLKKTYHLGKQTHVYALQGISLEVYPGEFVAVMGPSGSGKSTFMNLIGCLDRPTSGEYWLNGKLVSRLANDELAAIRNRMLGFVFQGFNLLGRADALQNVALPLIYAGLSKHERDSRARKVLRLVGLGEFTHHKPNELSGGQQQRVAIARALINGPALLLADEPTGNLDSRTSVEILAVLQALNEQGLTIVLVTHDTGIAACAKRRVAFLDGRVVRDEPIAEPRSAQNEWIALMKEEAGAKA
ncbi:MAG TPA: ABC transporter ATP-binding protein [Ktedonosporobacter sp.]|nr:ABC transporter ATP-binding protein [Ktedonosporobacter sp.]